MLLQLLTFHHPWKEFRVESRNKHSVDVGKTGRTGLQIDVFRSWFYEPNSCTSLYLEKHWNPLWWQLFLLISKSLTKLLETVWKNICLIVCIPPSSKSHLHWPFPPGSLGQFLRDIWSAVSWAAVLILPQIKLNSQLSHCAFFFQSTEGRYSHPIGSVFLENLDWYTHTYVHTHRVILHAY